MTECSICCESFNKSTRLAINCATCDDEGTVKVCRSCAKRYILDQPNNPCCMVCKVEWDVEFLNKNFPKVFISKELKEHKENLLLERQLALLPETQQYAENLKLADGLEKQKNIIEKEKAIVEKKFHEYRMAIAELNLRINELRDGRNIEDKDKTTFTFKCPVHNCNGFLNQSYSCSMCDNKICRHCMEIKNENHVCDEEKKQTVELLKKDTKPCPKCGQLICKIQGGCDQMYCIKCHTAFSWRSGKIDNGNIHNPEYYRWMRENGKEIPRNPLDVRYDPCGNVLINYPQFLEILRKWYPPKNKVVGYSTTYEDHPYVVKIVNMHRLVYHIDDVNNVYNREVRTEQVILRNMRASYLLNKIDKKEFKIKIQMLDKKRNKNKKINDVWGLLRLVLIEYIGKIIEANNQYNVNHKEIIKNIIKESRNIREFCNNSFYKIGSIYKMTYPGITFDWHHVYNWEKYLQDVNKLERTNLENEE